MRHRGEKLARNDSQSLLRAFHFLIYDYARRFMWTPVASTSYISPPYPCAERPFMPQRSLRHLICRRPRPPTFLLLCSGEHANRRMRFRRIGTLGTRGGVGKQTRAKQLHQGRSDSIDREMDAVPAAVPHPQTGIEQQYCCCSPLREEFMVNFALVVWLPSVLLVLALLSPFLLFRSKATLFRTGGRGN